MTSPADWRDVTALCAPGEETVTRLELIEDGVDVAEVYASMFVEPGTIILINTALITEEFKAATELPVQREDRPPVRIEDWRSWWFPPPPSLTHRDATLPLPAISADDSTEPGGDTASGSP